jgi:hypothetical protein
MGDWFDPHGLFVLGREGRTFFFLRLLFPLRVNHSEFSECSFGEVSIGALFAGSLFFFSFW